jgi:uncharacterized coiled-coil DUF342 family protein
MAEMTNLEGLPTRVEQIEQKLDALSDSIDQRLAEVNERFDAVDQRFDAVDKRFDEVSEHFVEQREYTEFAFDKLRGEMLDGFTRLASLIAANTSGLARLERKFDQFVDDEGRRPRRRRFPKKR